MLKGSEKSSVWIALKREFDRLRWDYIRLENKVSLGLPDVNVHVPVLGDVWIELKFVRRAFDVVGLGLRREQYNWMRAGKKAGRRVLLVAKVGTSWYCWDDPIAWELAKRNCDWNKLKRLSHGKFDAARELVQATLTVTD